MGEASVLQVVIFREGSLVGSEVFQPGDYAVGSDPGCELVLADEVVGRCQAFMSFREGKVTLQNVAGDVGMTVNGAPLKMADVRALDDVTIGPYLLKFRVVSQKARAPGASAAAAGPQQPMRASGSTPHPEAKAAPRAHAPAAAPSPAAKARPPTPLPVPPPKPTAPTAPARPAGLRHVAVAAAAPASAVATEREIPVPGKPLPEAEEERTVPAVALASILPSADAAPAGPAPRSVLDLPKKPRNAGPPPPVPAEFLGEPDGKEPLGPSLRVRVFWGKAAVGVYGFAFGKPVFAGPADNRDVPIYRLELPSDTYQLAMCDTNGWVARVPKAMRAYRFDPAGWRPVEGSQDGEAIKVKLEAGKLVRLGDASYSVELRVEKIKQAPRATFKDFARSGALLPFGLVGVMTVAMVLGVIFMPKYSRESSDFTPQQMLRAAKAILKPPEKEKKKEEKKKEEKKEEKKVEKKEEKVEQVVPSTKAANVNKAIQAVKKVVNAGPAVESLLKATTKLAGGPKGYGDKGMGYKLSPLIGKPPIAMAGMGFGPGMGGFGTETKGIGAIRGMGGGGGGGIGVFAAGGTGKGKVAGTVVSAPSSGFKQRGGGGSLARELIAKVINEHLGEVRGCYERALLKEAGLAGKLVLEWTIDLTGHVSEIKVKQATIKGSDVPNCIVGSLKNWVFPKPTGGTVIVSYPFLFNSVGF